MILFDPLGKENLPNLPNGISIPRLQNIDDSYYMKSFAHLII